MGWVVRVQGLDRGSGCGAGTGGQGRKPGGDRGVGQGLGPRSTGSGSRDPGAKVQGQDEVFALWLGFRGRDRGSGLRVAELGSGVGVQDREVSRRGAGIGGLGCEAGIWGSGCKARIGSSKSRVAGSGWGASGTQVWGGDRVFRTPVLCCPAIRGVARVLSGPGSEGGRGQDVGSRIPGHKGRGGVGVPGQDPRIWGEVRNWLGSEFIVRGLG